jgi:hypothetical protein
LLLVPPFFGKLLRHRNTQVDGETSPNCPTLCDCNVPDCPVDVTQRQNTWAL